ncbi:hypothetical protein ACJIZ3_010958 [Penstemon smallii]|uniref:HSF-type DNA-binding domain-containing protein n=1 Tax=Penstemon smallii TaxID=265156 RepID=A0ABD3UK02_9LAMI
MEENQKKIKNEPYVIELDNDDENIGGEGGSYTTESGGASQSGTMPYGIWREPPPPFLVKIYEMVENEEIKSIIIWDHNSFAANVLPIYFGWSNFTKFVRQLNTYVINFLKTNINFFVIYGSCMQWEYKNKYFRKGHRHLLHNIKRRDTIPKRKASEIGEGQSNSASLIEKELEKLTKEHDILKLEMSKLQEQHHVIKSSFDYLVIKDQMQKTIHSKIEETIQEILLKRNEDNGMLLKAVDKKIEETIQEILLKRNEDNGMLLKAVDKGKEKVKVEEKSDTTRSSRHDEGKQIINNSSRIFY